MQRIQRRFSFTRLFERSLHSNSSSSSEYVDVEYQDEETYLDVTLNIFGYGKPYRCSFVAKILKFICRPIYISGGGEWTIKSGRLTYPFQFILPLGLPSSFEGENGSIEYSLEAVIGQSWAFDYKSHTNFHVVGIVDLNSEPTAQMPIVVKACKTFGVIFESGPLDITLRLPKGGAVPGEYVPFIAEIFNKSDKTVTEYLSIQQVNKYFAVENRCRCPIILLAFTRKCSTVHAVKLKIKRKRLLKFWVPR